MNEENTGAATVDSIMEARATKIQTLAQNAPDLNPEQTEFFKSLVAEMGGAIADVSAIAKANPIPPQFVENAKAKAKDGGDDEEDDENEDADKDKQKPPFDASQFAKKSVGGDEFDLGNALSEQGIAYEELEAAPIIDTMNGLLKSLGATVNHIVEQNAVLLKNQAEQARIQDQQAADIDGMRKSLRGIKKSVGATDEIFKSIGVTAGRDAAAPQGNFAGAGHDAISKALGGLFATNGIAAAAAGDNGVIQKSLAGTEGAAAAAAAEAPMTKYGISDNDLFMGLFKAVNEGSGDPEIAKAGINTQLLQNFDKYDINRRPDSWYEIGAKYLGIPLLKD